MSLIYIHESIIKNTTSPSMNPISMLDRNSSISNNYIDISFCDLQSVNNYLNSQITNFSNTFSTNNQAKISILNCGEKTMQQRYLDILTMQLAFNGILSNLSKHVYGDDFLNLKDTQQQNINMRQTLTTELNELSRNDPNEIFKSAQFDSTIYSTILWIILAIVLIYYIFIRLDGE